MVLIPLGISINSWTRSIDPKSKNRSSTSDSGLFTDDSGSNTFHRVKSVAPASKHSISSKMTQNIVSPMSQILAQTKEREKLSDAPDDSPISLNMAASSSASKQKKKTKAGKKKSPPASTSTARKMKSSIKRLQKKRISQSKAGSGGSKKRSNIKKK